MGSGSGETNVHRSGLLSMAKFWDGSATTMNSISYESDGLSYYGDTGVFGEYVDAYNQMAQMISTWTGQGQTQMNDIADALVTAAKRYDNTESQNTGAANSVGHHH